MTKTVLQIERTVGSLLAGLVALFLASRSFFFLDGLGDEPSPSTGKSVPAERRHCRLVTSKPSPGTSMRPLVVDEFCINAES